MKNVIATLEDDARRQAEMAVALASLPEAPEYIFFDNAPDMIAWLEESLDKVVLLSLDHDIIPLADVSGRSCDPGTGRDVADYLASQKPVCPIIIHTSNYTAGEGMQFALTDAGWHVRRVNPMLDLDWIRTDWLPLVQKLRLRKS